MTTQIASTTDLKPDVITINFNGPYNRRNFQRCHQVWREGDAEYVWITVAGFENFREGCETFNLPVLFVEHTEPFNSVHVKPAR